MKISLSGIFFTVFVLLRCNCYAQETASLDLLNNAKAYDGKIVVYKGEVIGDIMIRGEYAWLHVNDGYIAIGIWAPKTLIEDIRYAGDYRQKGDTVEILGTFHRSCPEHGGDLDIHASGIKKVSPGSVVTLPISRRKISIGILSLTLVLLFGALKKLFQGRKKSIKRGESRFTDRSI